MQKEPFDIQKSEAFPPNILFKKSFVPPHYNDPQFPPHELYNTYNLISLIANTIWNHLDYYPNFTKEVKTILKAYTHPQDLAKRLYEVYLLILLYKEKPKAKSNEQKLSQMLEEYPFLYKPLYSFELAKEIPAYIAPIAEFKYKLILPFPPKTYLFYCILEHFIFLHNVFIPPDDEIKPLLEKFKRTIEENIGSSWMKRYTLSLREFMKKIWTDDYPILLISP